MREANGQAMPDRQDTFAVAAGGVMRQLDRIEQLLRDLLLDSEQEPDFDQTFIVGGTFAGAAVVQMELPRTLRHVEITLSVTSPVEVALLPGFLTLAQAQGQHGHPAAGANSNAIVSSGGGAVTARDYLDQSGWITAYFAAAITGYANVRIRSLDATQYRAQRT